MTAAQPRVGRGVPAGGQFTEERAAHLTRCGIPPHRIGDFKDSADPWVDGAPFRARYEAEEERQAATWAAMRGPAKKWPYMSPSTH